MHDFGPWDLNLYNKKTDIAPSAVQSLRSRSADDAIPSARNPDVARSIQWRIQEKQRGQLPPTQDFFYPPVFKKKRKKGEKREKDKKEFLFDQFGLAK